ncbi:hypothetical protein AO268_02935 [Pseudomonas sp. ICMP 8385]|nr:hypothetical protein AO268_02935 [Pseudomonas sp. ICMP 8385]
MVPLLDQMAAGGAQAPVGLEMRRVDTRGGGDTGRAHGGNAQGTTAQLGAQGRGQRAYIR